MESKLQIGLIAPEADLEFLTDCLCNDSGADTAFVSAAAHVSWLSCSLTNPQTPALLAQTDAVVIGAKLDRDRDASSLNSTLRMLQRNERNVLAVAVWGQNAQRLVSLVDWQNVLVAASTEADYPPADLLRGCVVEIVNRRHQETVRDDEAIVTRTTQFQSSATASTPGARTLSSPQRNIGGRQVRDLSHLRQRAGGAVKGQTSQLRMSQDSQPVVASKQPDFHLQNFAAPGVAETETAPDEMSSAASTDSASLVRELETVRRELADLRTSTNQHIKTLESENRFLSGKVHDQSNPSLIRELQEQLSQSGHELDAARSEINRLAEQLTAADERAQFAETRTEDFFQRFAKERKRAAEVVKQLAEANSLIATLSSKSEGNAASVEQARLQIARLERVRDVLINERDRALKERDEARAQISRMDVNLKSVNAEYLSTASQLKQQLQQLEKNTKELAEERDRVRAECDAAMARIETLEENERQTRIAAEHFGEPEQRLQELEALSEEAMLDRDRLRNELEQERGLYHDLEHENQLLTEEKNRLLDDLQAVSTRMLELETLLSDSALVNVQRAATAENLFGETSIQSKSSIVTIGEGEIDSDAMFGEDLMLILRIESALLEGDQETTATQANGVTDLSSASESDEFDDVVEPQSESFDQTLVHSPNSF